MTPVDESLKLKQYGTVTKILLDAIKLNPGDTVKIRELIRLIIARKANR
jgi:hypothetical protein